MDENLHALLNPRSVAVIGISRNPDSFGYPLVEIALRCGYTGKLHLVNPKADSILGLKCYPSILEVPGEVDVAMIMVPQKIVPMAVEECIAKSVKGMVIISAGFAEQGQEGKTRQDEMVEKVLEKGIRIVGPNTLGYFSAPMSMDLIMSGFIAKGDAALVTQSGNLTQSLTFPGSQRGLGFRYVVGLGNQADLQHHDFVRYFREDAGTKAIALHIEGLRDGRRFMEEVREAAKAKPVVVLKSGRTEKGAKVASSHTASLAGNDAIYQAAFKQCGAIQADSFTELASLLLAFTQTKPPKGNRVCIISEGGGDCALTSDACVLNGLEVPELDEAIQNRLKEFVPPNGSVSNPLDLAGWENVAKAAEVVLETDSIDGVIVVGGFAGNFHISPKDYQKEEECVRRMCKLLRSAEKPVLIYSYSGYKPSKLTDILKEHKIPLFLDHHDAVNAMAAWVKYAQVQQGMENRPHPSFACAPSASENQKENRRPASGPLLETKAKELLRQYGIPSPAERLAADADEAATAASDIGFPVAMKIVSKDILHKSDANGVKLGIADEQGASGAFQEIVANAKCFNPQAEISGVLVSKMDACEGIEVIVGGVNDPVFGPVLMFGLGGIFVEVLKDVSFRVCPVDETEAEEMIKEIKGYPLLCGVRGKKAVDLDSVKSALVNVARMMVENPWIDELDLNPIKVHEDGLLALDARVIASTQP